jgi:hypothetical protein
MKMRDTFPKIKLTLPKSLLGYMLNDYTIIISKENNFKRKHTIKMQAHNLFS